MNVPSLVLVSLLGIPQDTPTTEAYPVAWTRQLGTSESDFGTSVAIDGDGNVFMAGFTFGSIGKPNAGISDGFVSKYDPAGNLQWAKQFGTSSYEPTVDIGVDGTGNIYLTGQTGGSFDGMNAGSSDAFLIKLDAMGEELWARQLGTIQQDVGRSLAVDNAGNVWVSGEYNSKSEGPPSDAFLALYNANGEQQWFRSTTTTEFDVNEGVAIDAMGNAYVTGFIDRSGDDPPRSNDSFLAKYDVDGNLVWRQEFGTLVGDNAYEIAVDAFGAIYVSGTTGGLLGDEQFGSSDAFVTKFNGAGVLQWTTQFGSNRSDSIQGIDIAPDGTIFVSGSTNEQLGDEHFGSGDVFVSQIATDGELLWTRQIGSSFSEQGRGIAVDSMGNPYVTGQTRGSLDGENAGFADAILIKLQAPNIVPEPRSVLIAFPFLIGCFARLRKKHAHIKRRSTARRGC